MESALVNLDYFIFYAVDQSMLLVNPARPQSGI